MADKVEPIAKSGEVTLNGNKLSSEDFHKRKEDLEKKKGIKVEKITEGTYRTKIQG